MKSAQISYLVMLAVFGAGLWLILRVGSRLEAPKDIAGEWTLKWSDSTGDFPKRLSIHQSGRFITAELQWNDASEWFRGDLDRDLNLQLEAAWPRLTARLDKECRSMRGHFEGHVSADFEANRIVPASADFR